MKSTAAMYLPVSWLIVLRLTHLWLCASWLHVFKRILFRDFKKEVDLQEHHISIHTLYYLNMMLGDVKRSVMRKRSSFYLWNVYCKAFVWEVPHRRIQDKTSQKDSHNNQEKWVLGLTWDLQGMTPNQSPLDSRRRGGQSRTDDDLGGNPLPSSDSVPPGEISPEKKTFVP